ncbi:tRNA (uracil(54)-C(5))-methyltransferase [Kingella potus]|uniref:tRNA/tmRNA (uracil-C(5))-methyltransferase n=2 Tax=Kingella potus TaxID=265175 RepID=A0A377R1I3_9NEIS|nr:tRNA (uridine(54)-C5)-methyltransferase TrmA [Kingella potus]STR00949.1 tRNA (uracil(54)-C(5))-methyltransferase [Kingella potus]
MHGSDYIRQLDDKAAFLRRLFADIDMPGWEIFPSPEQHYRMRAEFRIWHEGGTIRYAMFERGRKAGGASVVRLTQFSAASAAINALMPELLAALSAEEVLHKRLFQCEFLSTLSSDMLVSLIYHRKLDDAWRTAAEALQQRCGIALIGRSKGQKIVLSRDFVSEAFLVNGQLFRYRQPEGGFSQPNAAVCVKMLEWACGCAQGLGGDLLELYCGNGNFTLPLARHFRRVLATEVSKTSVQAAQWNIEANGADNIRIARLSAEEFAQAASGSREFRRLREQGISLADYAFSTVFVDPPRAGVDEATLRLLQNFDNIIYISCNPETLRANLDLLLATHDIKAAALFDQFPFTPHIESGVLLRRKAV